MKGDKHDGRRRGETRLKALPTEADKGILGKDGKCNCKKRDGSDGRCQQRAGYGTDHPGFGACVYHGGDSPSLRRHAAKVEARMLAQELDMEPDVALAWMVRAAAGVVAFLQERISQEDTEPEALMWVGLYGEERDRLAKAAKLMLDAGVAERQVKLAEEQGAIVAQLLRSVLADLQLTPQQKLEAPKIVRKHLLALPAVTG